MSETSETLAFFTQGWQNYQNQLSIALARLSPEQLALRAAPDLRSIDESDPPIWHFAAKKG